MLLSHSILVDLLCSETNWYTALLSANPINSQTSDGHAQIAHSPAYEILSLSSPTLFQFLLVTNQLCAWLCPDVFHFSEFSYLPASLIPIQVSEFSQMTRDLQTSRKLKRRQVATYLPAMQQSLPEWTHLGWGHNVQTQVKHIQKSSRVRAHGSS